MSVPTAFKRAVEELKPGASGSDIVALLDGKANRCTALDWKAGRVHAPRWALDLLAAKIHARASALLLIAAQTRATPERPGKRAGAVNLARYLAARNA